MNSEQTSSWTVDEIGMAILKGELSPADLTQEQRVAWFPWEPPPVPLTSFHLGTEEHRQEFLYQYQWQGDDVLFCAIAHIWDSLERDKAAHCILVGLLSGTGGKGKTALRLTLQKFLAECLEGPATIPKSTEFESLHAWNAAVHQQWDGDEARVRELCARYSAILDGRAPEEVARATEPEGSNVMLGPWL